MTDLVQWVERPELDAPVLIVMLAGWIDTSSSAAAAMAALESDGHARTIARFDRDTFIDYRSRRPTMEIRDGVSSRLIWPDIELKTGTDVLGRSFLVLSGQEPDAAWEQFAAEVIGAATTLGVSKMVGLGAYPYASPHTRPARLSTTSPDPELSALLPYQRNSVDVPAGIVSVLEHAFHAIGIPAMTLWAQVPHYVSAMSYPAASVSLLDALTETASVKIDALALRGEAIVQRQRLDDLVAANDDHVTMVRQLEQVYDDLQATEPTHPSETGDSPMRADQLPSADELAAELEQFLRDQDS